MHLYILKQKFRKLLNSQVVIFFVRNKIFVKSEFFKKQVVPYRVFFRLNIFFSFSRFASGGNGECIQLGEEWMTPNKFEIRAGSKAKKYKVSIKCEQGISIGEYIAKGYLIENATRSKINATDPLNIDGGDSNQLQSKTRSTRSGRKA